ncbi:type I CRISPR-associated protein Cas8a1/Csx8 [Clostridium celatum]|uniref:type I CRISPR-associated protein Cas8a1/Csx8 n=1 Tax=Clostridium celatum TaxID=36834 RepID=UPI001896BE1E|nr:type I CRISPR-associated protein Cas8a1/Csx8 [Clostridium celatum]
MKSSLHNNNYDTKLEATDWRFSASILGLLQYFNYHNLDHEIEEDYILYNSSDISEEKYLEFVEYKYGQELHHKVIENILSNEEISEEQVKLVNDKLTANTVIKKCFNKIKFDNTNREYILDIIKKNRTQIIKETFRSKKNMYANYANTNQLFNEDQEYCRLLGYCIDVGKKGKSTGYNFTTSTFVGEDMMEFDFVPFAFLGNNESFFINDNYTIERLKASNESFKRIISVNLDENNGCLDARQALFRGIIESADFIKRDVEIIFKNISQGYFETVYLRKDSINVLKAIKDENIDYKSFNTYHKITDKYYMYIQKEVMECIVNNMVLDNIIEISLKANKSYLVTQLIKTNILIRGNKGMKDRLKGAYACSKKVAEVLEKNKLDSYKQKLTSSIIFKDYDRVCQILLQLSNYSGIEFGFVYDLFDDFEANKDLAYTFINALSKSDSKLKNNDESK